ncbi:hypothetical protein P5704_024760 (plasmid) [Pseudomonas sp. FeN3W]|nr:hypothetical protein P5704_024760 [Pseudomonas sp. FeN3W]
MKTENYEEFSYNIKQKLSISNNHPIVVIREYERLAFRGKIFLNTRYFDILEDIVINFFDDDGVTQFGIAIIDSYKLYIEMGFSEQLNYVVAKYDKFFEKTSERVRARLKKAQSNLSDLRHKLTNRSTLKILSGKIQIYARDAIFLLENTSDMDDLIIDSMGLSKGIIDIDFIFKDNSGSEIEVINKDIVSRILLLTINKDSTGRLFERTAGEYYNSPNFVYTRFCISNLIELSNSKPENNKSNNHRAIIQKFINKYQNTIIQIQEMRSAIANNMEADTRQRIRIDRIKPFPLKELLWLSEAGGYNLAKIFAGSCYLTEQGGGNIYDVHNLLFHDEHIPSVYFINILNNTIESCRYNKNSAFNIDKYGFVQYSIMYNINDIAEQLNEIDDSYTSTSEYIEQLAKQYKQAIYNNDIEVENLYKARILNDLESLSKEFIELMLVWLKKHIPSSILMSVPSIKIISICKEFEI